jgi:hypothetical protein
LARAAQAQKEFDLAAQERQRVIDEKAKIEADLIES